MIGVIASAAGGSSDDGDNDDSSATDTSDPATSTDDTEPTKKADKPDKSPEPEESSEPEPEEPEPEPEPDVIKVTAAKILKEFEDNEAAADLKYGDHQLLEVTGFVSKVDTELFHDDRYVIKSPGRTTSTPSRPSIATASRQRTWPSSRSASRSQSAATSRTVAT